MKRFGGMFATREPAPGRQSWPGGGRTHRPPGQWAYLGRRHGDRWRL